MTTTITRQVARADLCRTAPFALRGVDAAGDVGDGQTIDGYAAVYGRDLASGQEPSADLGWALIDSWEGTFWERFREGAFKKSIREKLPRMQFDHGRHPLLGSLPLGRWNAVTEEEAGLHTVGRLSDNWLVEPFRDAIRDEAIDGMSIQFEVVREEWRDVEGKLVRDDEELLQLLWRPDERGPLRRSVLEAKLPEAGPVTWPAYAMTSVGVRSVTIDLGRLHDRAQRSLLARAVLLTDAADADQSPPRATGITPAGEHRDDEPAQHDDTPRSTDAGQASAGEHESHPPTDTERALDDVDRWRLGLNSRRTDPLHEVDRVLAALG